VKHINILFVFFGLFYTYHSYAESPLNSGDLLCDAIPIIVNAPEITGDNSIASAEPNEPLGSCWWTGNPLNSIWYSFVAPSSGRVSVSTSFENTSLNDSHIAIYDVGNCADMTTLTELACDEDSGVLFTALSTANDLIPGKTYYIQVDGYEDKIGEFKIKVIELPGCTGLSSPLNGSNNVPLNATLVWNAVLGMNNYNISVSGVVGANNLINNLNLGNSTTYTPAQNWSTNTTYQITIVAFNDQGDTISCPPTNFTTGSFIAQAFGPGGITSNNVFWAKANKDVLFNGTNISEWQDQSAGSNHAVQADTSQQPLFHPHQTNYNPSVYFDGNNDFLQIPNLIAASSKNISVIAVGTNEQGGDSWHSMVFGQSNSNWLGGGYGICGLDGAANSFGFWVNSWSSNAVAAPLLRNKTTILEGKYEGSQILYYKDAHLEGTTPYTGEIGDVGSTYLGGGEANDYNHKGFISEVIIYDNDLAESERQKINSYLAIKYGITLYRDEVAGKYINSVGTNIYSSDSTFWHNIIGIGRDDNAALLQKQSHQADDTTRLYLANLASSNITNKGNYTTDNQSIVIGHNGKSILSAQQNDAPIGVHRITDRAWKVQNTNFIGSFSLEFLLEKCSMQDISDIRLLASTSSDFSSAQILSQSNGLTISKNGAWLIIGGISNNHINQNSTTYITLASTQLSQETHYFSKTLCPEASLTINGTLYNETNPSGTEIFQSVDGCDSLVEVSMFFNGMDSTSYNLVLCQGDSIVINGNSYNEDNPYGTETLTSHSGCDSIININLEFQQSIQVNFHRSICASDSILINGNSYNEDNPSGIETLSTLSGCDSIINIELEILSDYPDLENDFFSFSNIGSQEFSLFTNDYLPANWEFFLLNTNHPDWFLTDSNGWVNVESQKGEEGEVLTIDYMICDATCNKLCDTANAIIQYDHSAKEDVLVSDVLTLNGDGKNDALIFKDLNTATNQGIQVFNRWGNLVFAEAPYQNSWKGTNQNGDPMPNGTYYYILSIVSANGDIIQGDVLLIR